MILNHCYKAVNLILATTLVAGLGLVTHASAQTRLQSVLVDLNSRTITEIGNLGGYWTFPVDINDTGQVVGRSTTVEGEGVWHGFITGPGGMGIRDLGSLGGNYTIASGVNDAGQVVGYSYTDNGQAHAFITGPNGMGMRDLGTLGEDYSDASAINDAGREQNVRNPATIRE